MTGSKAHLWAIFASVALAGCNIPVDAINQTQYNVWITPKIAAGTGGMPAVPGASYATTGIVTGITSTNGPFYNNTIAASATVTIDNSSPANPTGFSGTPGNLKVEELFVPGKRLSLPKRDAAGLLFNQVDRAVKVWEKRGLRNIRARAIREAERWIMERTHYSDGLGAIYPSMMYLIMALDSLSYAKDHPDFVDAVSKFENLITETPSRFQFQPCFSPVWDSALSYWGIQQSVPFTLPIDVTAASLPLTGMTVNTGPANTTGFGLTNVNLAAGTATMVGTYTAAPSGSQQTVKINAINAELIITSIKVKAAERCWRVGRPSRRVALDGLGRLRVADVADERRDGDRG